MLPLWSGRPPEEYLPSEARIVQKGFLSVNTIRPEEMGRRPLTSDELLEVRLESAEDPRDFLGFTYGMAKIKKPLTGLRALDNILKVGW